MMSRQASHGRRGSVAPFVSCPEQAVQSVVGFLGLCPQSVLLEIGCGDGRVLQKAASSSGALCIGVDIDEEAIEAARARLTEKARMVNGPPAPRNIRLIHADVFAADDKVPWDRVDIVLMHLTTASHHRLWSFLQGRIRDGTTLVTMQFPVPHVKAVVEKEVSFPPSSRLEQGSISLYSYRFPGDDRSVRLQLDAWLNTTATSESAEAKAGSEGSSSAANVEVLQPSSRLRVAYSVHGGPARRTDYLGLYALADDDDGDNGPSSSHHHLPPECDDYLDFGFVSDSDLPSGKGLVELQLPSTVEGEEEEGRKKRRRKEVEVRYYNQAGICLGRRRIVLE